MNTPTTLLLLFGLATCATAQDRQPDPNDSCGPAPQCAPAPDCRLDLQNPEHGDGSNAHAVNDYRTCLLQRQQSITACDLARTNYSACIGDKNDQDAATHDRRRNDNDRAERSRE